MRSKGQDCGTGIALGRGYRRRRSDFVSATDCGIHCGSAIRAMKTKRTAAVVAALVAFMVFAWVYSWGPSKTPPTQKPLLTLTTADFDEFEAAFDEATDGQRLVLLLSPT
jgi:hypothetical protein